VADLVTHICIVLLPGAFLRLRGLPLVVLGAALPDLAARVPAAVLEAVDRRIGLPQWLLPGWSVFHEPLPLLALCAALACAFVPGDRRRALLCLWAGVATHLALDVLQDHHGRGYMLAFPLNWDLYELGWIGSQATVPIAPWLALATAIAWAASWLMRVRSRPRSADD
jgi:hypothetical protein